LTDASALLEALDDRETPAWRPTLPMAKYALQACHAAGDVDRAFALFDWLARRFEPDAKAVCVTLQTIAAQRSSARPAVVERGLHISQRAGFLPWRANVADEERWSQEPDADARHEAFWRPKLARALDVLLARLGEPPTSPRRLLIRQYFAELIARNGHAGVGMDTGGMRPVRTDIAPQGENKRARRRARRLIELAERDAALARLANTATGAEQSTM